MRRENQGAGGRIERAEFRAGFVEAVHVRHSLREIRAGQRIGEVGCTGSCEGDHLHFEIRLGHSLEAKPIDPLPIIRRWPQLK